MQIQPKIHMIHFYRYGIFENRCFPLCGSRRFRYGFLRFAIGGCMKKSIAAVCTIFMCAALFISCGGKKNEKVVYWSMWNEAEPQGQVIAEAVREFEKGHQNRSQFQRQGYPENAPAGARCRGNDRYL